MWTHITGESVKPGMVLWLKPWCEHGTYERSQAVVKFTGRTNKKLYYLCLLWGRTVFGFEQRAMESILYFVLYSINTLDMWYKYGQTRSILPAVSWGFWKFQSLPELAVTVEWLCCPMNIFPWHWDNCCWKTWCSVFMTWIEKVEKLEWVERRSV